MVNGWNLSLNKLPLRVRRVTLALCKFRHGTHKVRSHRELRPWSVSQISKIYHWLLGRNPAGLALKNELWRSACLDANLSNNSLKIRSLVNMPKIVKSIFWWISWHFLWIFSTRLPWKHRVCNQMTPVRNAFINHHFISMATVSCRHHFFRFLLQIFPMQCILNPVLHWLPRVFHVRKFITHNKRSLPTID